VILLKAPVVVTAKLQNADAIYAQGEMWLDGLVTTRA
jgi:hypothetical protein